MFGHRPALIAIGTQLLLLLLSQISCSPKRRIPPPTSGRAAARRRIRRIRSPDAETEFSR
jgi:hypothetical protein